MSDRLPVYIDPIRFAQQGRTLQGRLPLSSLARLAGLLLSGQGEVEVYLDFHKDERGRFCLSGELRTTLELECQRCLQAMHLPIDDHFSLVLVETEAEAELVGEEDEVLIIDSASMMLNDIIEDELMLSLPQVAMHDEAECSVSTQHYSDAGLNEEQQAADEEPSPFAVLAEIKRKDD